MATERYVEHVLSTLSTKPRQELQAHFDHLDQILRKIQDVASPDREALLVELILETKASSNNHESWQGLSSTPSGISS